MGRERVVFLAAVGVIAVHVLDDSFIQPEDGTSAGDHLVSGLVPLAALGIAAAAYPRLRAGWRATLALFIGMFGVVAGLEGWHYTREVGASGDDYTGLVALPAGVVLADPRRRHALALTAPGGKSPAALPAACADRRGGVDRGDCGDRSVHGGLRLHAPGPSGRARSQARRRGIREREVRDQRRPGARGLVHPLEERGGGDRVPRPQRPASGGLLPGPPRLRRAALRPARGGGQRRRSQLARAGAGRRTWTPRSRSCASDPTSTPSGSAGSGARSGARCSSRWRPTPTRSRPWSRRAPASARSARASSCRAARSGRSSPPGRQRRSGSWSSPAGPRRRT